MGLNGNFLEVIFRWCLIYNLLLYYNILLLFDYHIYKNEDLQCVWKMSEFEGIKACFLIDVYPYSKKNFNKAVREMVRQMKHMTGLFIYVGYLPTKPFSMVRIPHKFQPKNFHFVSKIIDKSKMSEEDMLNINNWDVNLSSYDLL